MNNKHLIKELREILVKNFDLIPGSTVVQHTEDQLLALILSEKNDLINKIEEDHETWHKDSLECQGLGFCGIAWVLSQLEEVKE